MTAFTIFLGILLTIAVFTIIVFFHELGHFALAKLFGVRVDEFGIGIPPRACKLWRDRSGTEYTLNWLPIGGFVRLYGEVGDESLRGDQTALANKPLYQQLLVVLGGVFMNFVLAIVVLAVLFMVGVAPLGINTKFDTDIPSRLVPSMDQARTLGILEVDGLTLSPLTGSIAEQAGVRSGDILLSVDGHIVSSPKQMIAVVSAATSTVHLTVRRGSGSLDIPVTPDKGKIGAYVGYNITKFNKDFVYQYPPVEAVEAAVDETYNMSALTLDLLGSLVVNVVHPATPQDRAQAVDSLSGPVGIGNLFTQLVDMHVPLSVVMVIVAVISINLGVFNLLPFPALDGGRAFFLILNGLTRLVLRRDIVGGSIEGYVHAIGFSLLILISIFVAYHDIARIMSQ